MIAASINYQHETEFKGAFTLVRVQVQAPVYRF